MLNRWNFLKTGFYEGINLCGLRVDQMALRELSDEAEDLLDELGGLDGVIQLGGLAGVVSGSPFTMSTSWTFTMPTASALLLWDRKCPPGPCRPICLKRVRAAARTGIL